MERLDGTKIAVHASIVPHARSMPGSLPRQDLLPPGVFESHWHGSCYSRYRYDFFSKFRALFRALFSSSFLESVSMLFSSFTHLTSLQLRRISKEELMNKSVSSTGNAHVGALHSNLQHLRRYLFSYTFPTVDVEHFFFSSSLLFMNSR